MPIGKNGNGLTLLKRFIPDGLSHAATAFVESLEINTISEKRRRGRLVVSKRRNISVNVAAMGGELLPNAKWRSVSSEDYRRTNGLSG
jgi:hypothetical protein